jgi:hypothetical protein
MRLFVGSLALLLVPGFFVSPASGSSYDGKPKLAVILMFDQFRGDYLDRYRDDFKDKNGWNLFLKQGAQFTLLLRLCKPCDRSRTGVSRDGCLHRWALDPAQSRHVDCLGNQNSGIPV